MKTFLLRNSLIFIVTCGSVIATSCMSCMNPLLGKYYDESGGIILDLKSGGDATFTFAGQPNTCTYTVKGAQLNLACKGEASSMGFTVDKDGSLIPKSEFVTRMRKRT